MIKGLILLIHATSGSGHQLTQVSVAFDHQAFGLLLSWFDRTGRHSGEGKATGCSCVPDPCPKQNGDLYLIRGALIKKKLKEKQGCPAWYP